FKVRPEYSWHVLSDVATYTALLLGHTATVNDTSASGARTGDLTNFRHSWKSRERWRASRCWSSDLLAQPFGDVERAARGAVKLYSRNGLRHGKIGIFQIVLCNWCG